MISAGDMVSQMMGAVTPGLAGVQIDMMTIITFCLGIAVVMVGFIIVVSLLRGRIVRGGGYISDGKPIPGSKRWHYSGSRPSGLMTSNRYEE